MRHTWKSVAHLEKYGVRPKLQNAAHLEKCGILGTIRQTWKNALHWGKVWHTWKNTPNLKICCTFREMRHS